jgi:hypothetical protein
MTSHHSADEKPAPAALPMPNAALPGGPDGAGPLLPPPPGAAGGVPALPPEPGFGRGASAGRAAGCARSCGCPGAVPGTSGMSAAGAPLARIAAIGDGGGPACSALWRSDACSEELVGAGSAGD